MLKVNTVIITSNYNYIFQFQYSSECTAEDFDGFKYRFVEWFDMIEKDETSLDYIR